MTARNSAAAQAAALRAQKADGLAAQWEHGAKGEKATERLLRALNGPWWRRWLRRALGRPGWVIRHDLRLRGRRFNVDHVAVSPCGTAVVALDTKNWHRGLTTTEVSGRVFCGDEDRHDQVEKVVNYARLIEAALGMPGVSVLPLVVVHGSLVAGEFLEARVDGWSGPVYVLGPARLVPTLAAAPKGHDPARAAAVAARVDRVLLPYVPGPRRVR
ncbi:nuclease-related domain-containing protein [Streptomyces anulatus]|uniref:nuclease-related domain-containing protein n=1 Tax=Streptomyces anulatus TaxID=1892 RepID=UPI002E0FA790|nr:NERD domain-containing protein [Streptomyces anulatus]